MFLSPATHSAADVVRLLDLQPLAEEGGYFRRSGEAGLLIPGSALPPALGGADRRAWSVIYALFTPEAFSALHRLRTDELWFFHAGDPLESLRLRPVALDPAGDTDSAGTTAAAATPPLSYTSEIVRLGTDLAAGERIQDVVAAGVWQGTRLRPGGRWALVSCVVAPEFRWDDFELADRPAMERFAPEHTALISGLTRSTPPSGVR